MSIALPDLGLPLQRLPAPLPVWRAGVDRAVWLKTAHAVADGGGRLVSMWGTPAARSEPYAAENTAENAAEKAAEQAAETTAENATANVAYAVPEGLLWLSLPLPAPVEAGAPDFPDLSTLFPCAARMQRAMADLSGLRAAEAADRRPWLDHGLWAPGAVPLNTKIEPGAASAGTMPADYPFVRVEGDGVHEIAVGPVHAGIIEPGHFRFSVVGEKVLRLEAQLGYVHKGIERRFTELAPLDAHRLAGRVCGDSTVAYAWAYCMALESAWRCDVPQRAGWLRALLLERERVANHLGDLGALGNDAALAFGLAQFSRLREDWLRLNKDLFGHRLLMDAVLPGGVAFDLSQTQCDRLRQQCDDTEREVRALQGVYDEHAGLQDRFLTTGRVSPPLAAQLGLTGLAGRASGQAADLRCDHDWAPYAQFKVAMATSADGDVAARVAMRFNEVFESLRLVRAACSGLPQGALRADLAPPASHASPAFGAGWVEGWRGEVLIALQTGSDGRIVRCHCHDPSWQNWPVLEHAVIGNIVPDFPLINKSFNLSYSGHDL